MYYTETEDDLRCLVSLLKPQNWSRSNDPSFREVPGYWELLRDGNLCFGHWTKDHKVFKDTRKKPSIFKRD